MNQIQLLYPRSIKEELLPLISGLTKKGINVLENPIVFNPDEVGMACFKKEMDVDAYLEEIPLLKQQLDYSSIKHLRILPFFIYNGKEDDPEELFEGETGEFVESIFSGEFKPYGWDTSKEDNLSELLEILEENYSE